MAKVIGGIRFYNYNKSEEDTLRGTRTVQIWVDGRIVTAKRGIVLKKAPGKVFPEHDFGQTVRLPFSDGWQND